MFVITLQLRKSYEEVTPYMHGLIAKQMVLFTSVLGKLH